MIPLIIQAIEDSSDREFMENLYLTYRKLIYSSISRITNRDVDDLMQSTVEKLISHISTLRSLSQAKTAAYIVATAENTARTHLHKEYKISVISLDSNENLQDTLVSDFDIYDFLSQREQSRIFLDVWLKLSERDRTVLESKYMLSMTNEEMSEKLGIKVDSIRMAISRAKKSLKNYIEDTLRQPKTDF